MHQAIHPGHCGAQNCFEVHIIKGAAKRRAERAQDYSNKITAVRQQMSGRLAESDVIAVVPHQDGALAPLPEDRLAAFCAHLDRIIALAFDTEQQSTPARDSGSAPPVPPALAAAGCSACQGSCCRQGGGETHAFLTASSLRAVMESAPQIDAVTLRAEYLAALPERSVEGSCVYHGLGGCTLRRDRRANNCNSFFCYELNQMAIVLGDAVAGPVILAGVDQGQARKLLTFTSDSGAATCTKEPEL
tara:strand:+ start:79947 stop:80684 length:738 start_codon:yes stop_codon:yes gene_type:complete